MIALGILLLPDALAPTFTDFIMNVPLAMVIADFYGLAFLDALVATYLIALGLLVAGLMVYPYNTKRLLVGRLKAGAIFISHNPIMLVIALLSLLFVYLAGQWAYDNLYEYAKSMIGAI